MSRLPALLLLVALVGGLGTASVHQAHHAAEWAESQRSHDADHHDSDGDHASAPCDGGDLHGLDCAVCSSLSGTNTVVSTPTRIEADEAQQIAARVAWHDTQRAVAPARGPPTVA